MIEGWQWDPTLFAGTAEFYERGRLPYAPGSLDLIGRLTGGPGRLLDAGCGPGHVAAALAPFFDEVVGLDPDPGMLAVAGARGVGNARWVRARAEDLPAGLGTFRAVLFAQSFHWTDRERVAATVRGMLEPGGALVHLASQHQPPPATTPLPLPEPPYPMIADLVRRRLGPVRRAGQGRIASGRTPDREDVVIAKAGFGDYERHLVPGGQVVERDVDALVAWTFSRSDSAPHLFGEERGDVERELRAMLTERGGRFAEHLPPTEIRIWRTGQTR
ncbi:class I SAM-dependent methyltransferase [Actinoplanes philippinensis]|uniref:class I SAM-dependent methyltransferase n=1 Tax=Actinoplanes philippinensis TaxID=35752 RepID=UPI0034067BCE